MPTTLLPVLLATHIVLAIGLFLPSILLPFTLRARRATVESQSRIVRSLLWAQTHGTLVMGAGLALTGLGPRHRPGSDHARADRGSSSRWPSTSRISRSRSSSSAPTCGGSSGIKAAADDASWKERAKRQRYVSYLMAGLVGTIGFLMSTKPVLW